MSAAMFVGGAAGSQMPQPGPRLKPSRTPIWPAASLSDAWSTVTYHNVTIYVRVKGGEERGRPTRRACVEKPLDGCDRPARAQPTLTSNGYARPGIDTDPSSVIGVDEVTPFGPSFFINNMTQEAVIELAPGRTLWGQGVLNRDIALKDLDFIRLWTKRDVLTTSYHDWYVLSILAPRPSAPPASSCAPFRVRDGCTVREWRVGLVRCGGEDSGEVRNQARDQCDVCRIGRSWRPPTCYLGPLCAGTLQF